MGDKDESCCSCKKCGIITGAIIGVILVVLGGMLLFIFDVVFVNIVKSESVIKEGTDFYPEWVEPSPPVYLAFFVFNLTNEAEFLSQTPDNFVKPKFEQVGPYVYREYLKKDQIEFLDTEPEEVRYRSTTTIVFQPEMSGGTEDDMITTLNVIATGAPSILNYYFLTNGVGPIAQRPLKDALNGLINAAGSKLTFTKTLGELLFGFEDPLLSSIIDLAINASLIDENTSKTFGLFSTMNNSAGWFDYQVYTGKGNYELMNIVSRFQNMTELDYWFSDSCNAINGTDGTTTPAFMNKDERIYFFVDDICRSMWATYYQDVDIKGVPGWEYRVPPELFLGPSKNPENECYCPNPTLEICKHDGGITLATCQYGAPIFMTSPHFLYGDGFYLNQVEGLNPVEDEHCTPLVYEPNSGTCMRADKRLQINIFMEPIDRIDLMSQFTNTYAFPILWLNESYVLDDDSADLMYSLLVVPEETVSILQIVFCIIGSVLICVVLALGWWMYVNRNTLVPAEEKVASYSSSSGVGVYENEMVDEVFGNGKTDKPVNHAHDKNITSTASKRELLGSSVTSL